MTESTIQPTTDTGVPAPPPDDENPAIIDALQTFKITLISAVLFCLAAAFIIFRTRVG